MLSTLLERRRTGTARTRPGLRVLLVDDSDAFLEAAAELLQNDPRVGDVELARSGEEAIVFAAHYRPDVVFVDCQMPGVDGVAAVRAIRARTAPPAVVLLSLDPSIGSRRETLAAGADRFVSKSDFTGRVAEMLDWVTVRSQAGAPHAEEPVAA